MTEADLLRSVLGQVLAKADPFIEREAPEPGLPVVRTTVVACPYCDVVGAHDPICRLERASW